MTAETTSPNAGLIATLLRSFANKTLVHWAHGKEAADALAAADADRVRLQNAASATNALWQREVAQARKDAIEEVARIVDGWTFCCRPEGLAAAIRALAEKEPQ